MSRGVRGSQSSETPESRADCPSPPSQRFVPSPIAPIRWFKERVEQIVRARTQASPLQQDEIAAVCTVQQRPTNNSDRRENGRPPSVPVSQSDVPILYQQNPQTKSRYRNAKHINRSPTESLESRANWSRKERLILEMLHVTHPPTHEAVIKFLEPVRQRELRGMLRRARQNLSNWSKRHEVEFALYFTLEIERSNCIHLHLLLRTSTLNPSTVLREVFGKASKGRVDVRHCERVRQPEAISRYTVKDLKAVRNGSRKLYLFKKELRQRHSGQWNGYFVRPKKALWDDWKRLKYGNSAS